MTGTDAPKRSWIETFSVYFQIPIIQVFLLGIASGFPLLLTASTLTARLTESNIDIKLIGLAALIGLPYTFKFLASPIIDAVHLPKVINHTQHRKSWCILTQVMLSLSILGMAFADPQTDLLLITVFALLTAFFSAMQDIVIDAIRIEMLSKDSQGAGSAAAVFGYRIGMLMAGAGAFVLASFFSWSFVYTLAAVISACFIGITLSIKKLPEPDAPKETETSSTAPSELLNVDDERNDAVTEQPSMPEDKKASKDAPQTTKDADYAAWLYKAVIAPLLDFLKRKGAIVILLFIALYKLGDTMAGSLSTPFYLDMGFSKIEIAAVTKGVGVVAVLVGSFIGGLLVKGTTIIRALVVCGTLQILSNFVFVWLANVGADISVLTICICVENITGGMGTAAFVAYMSQLCNIRFTATQYALLSSLSSVGRTLFSSSAGVLVAQLDWAGFYVSTAAFGIPGMVLLYYVWKLTRDQNTPEVQ